MPSLDRNSEDSHESTALASTADTSGRSDNTPVLTQHAEQGALFRPRTFYLAADSLLEPGECSVGKEPVGELSLSGEPECLSLHEAILPQQEKSGNGVPALSPNKDLHSSCPPGTGLLLVVLIIIRS